MVTVIIALLFLQQLSIANGIIVHTPSGDIRGFSSNETDIFLGISYGEIPDRWSVASLPRPWDETKNATAFGSICYQFGPYKQPFLYNETEDCLFMNIWVPKHTNTGLLPVRLWIHGGGYTAGSSNDYDGSTLAHLSNSIIISINYRLGVFGYFPLPGIEERNLGWFDQRLAMRWIQENIVFFGGNPSNVLLFGQSAGGSSILAHILIEESWSLYSSAVLQSPAPFLYSDCADTEQKNWRILQEAFPQCHGNLTCFRRLNGSILYENSSLVWVTLWPCVGSRSQLLEQPITMIRKGLFNRQVPIIGGINFNEGQSSVLTFNHFQLPIIQSQYFLLAKEYLIPDPLIELYDPTTTDKDYFAALSWLFNDYYIHCPSLFLFNHLSNWSSPIYTYFFIHATEKWAFSPFHFNATHLTEIPYVFQSNFAAAELTGLEIELSSKIVNYFSLLHRHQQPWMSYRFNQTVLLFNTTESGSLQTQSGFDPRLQEKCPIISKYVDPLEF